jgi:hypothetical protein
MEVVRSSEISVTLNQTTRHQIPEEGIVHVIYFSLREEKAIRTEEVNMDRNTEIKEGEYRLPEALTRVVRQNVTNILLSLTSSIRGTVFF